MGQRDSICNLCCIGFIGCYSPLFATINAVSFCMKNWLQPAAVDNVFRHGKLWNIKPSISNIVFSLHFFVCLHPHSPLEKKVEGRKNVHKTCGGSLPDMKPERKHCFNHGNPPVFLFFQLAHGMLEYDLLQISQRSAANSQHRYLFLVFYMKQWICSSTIETTSIHRWDR